MHPSIWTLLDIVAPLPPSEPLNESYTVDHSYLATFADRATYWLAVPVPDIRDEMIAAAFLSVWISRFGVPLFVVTDRDQQFESEIFSHLAKLVGFHRLRISVYSPRSNGFIEATSHIEKCSKSYR